MITGIFINKENRRIWNRFENDKEMSLYYRDHNGIKIQGVFHDGNIFRSDEGKYLVLWLGDGDNWRFVQTESEIIDIVNYNEGYEEDIIIFTEGDDLSNYRTGDKFSDDFYRVLDQPLTINDIKVLNVNGYVEDIIKIDIEDIINNNLDGFLDIISNKLAGSVLLRDVTYSVDGTKDGGILLRVRGDASISLKEYEAGNEINL